ncbi:MAG TPA: chlorite dismutase family protein [Elusimicrobiales bacterium]|nr:chlorite dismutase family protein [Elusimicrobiales bacterium]
MEKPKRTTNVFSSFMFLKLAPEFRRLISNEKIAAKQEFENMVGACQEKVFLRTYMITGLRPDADLLFWRVSDDLERLQDICARTFSVGVGHYLLPTHTYLGVYHPDEQACAKRDLEFSFLPKDVFGRHKFMLVHPVVKSHLWYELSEDERRRMQAGRSAVIAKYREIQETFFQSYGLDEQEMIVTREARHLDELVSATRELREQRIKNYTAVDKPVFLCIGRDLREILDSIT